MISIGKVLIVDMNSFQLRKMNVFIMVCSFRLLMKQVSIQFLLFLSFLYNIIRRIMRKQNSSYSLSSQRVPSRRPISFQKVLKRRNETIAPAQLYETQPSAQSQKVQCRPHTQSASIGLKIKKSQPEVNIKQYVKQMGAKRTEPDGRQYQKSRENDRRRNTESDWDRKSQYSCRSNASSSFIVPELKSMAVKKIRTIEELQGKIESLINQSLKIIKKQRSSMGLTKWAQIRKASSLDEDFKQIQTYFCELRSQIEEEQNVEKLVDLDRKIELLQKMIASENTESDILREQYFNWKSQRGNTTSYVGKLQLGDMSRFNTQLRGLNSRNNSNGDGHRGKAPVTKFDSTNKTSFKKPSKEYYLAQKQKRGSYSLNRQPMQRSSYSAQFLNYGYVPTYCHKNDSVPQLVGTSLAVKASTYQQEYRQKLGLSKNICIKDLDCCHDKYKNPNISFIRQSKKTLGPKGDVKKSHRDINKNAFEKENNSFCLVKKNHEPSMIACMNRTTSGDFYKTEHGQSYIWHNKATELCQIGNKDVILKSQIKDKKLNKMKNVFRNIAFQK